MRFRWFGGVSLSKTLGAAVRVGFVLLLSVGATFPAEAVPNKPAARDRSFHQFVASLWPLAQECGVSRATFDRAFAGVSFDPKVAAAADEQPEFIRPIWDYLAAAVSPSRIERGRHKAQAEAAWLAKAC